MMKCQAWFKCVIVAALCASLLLAGCGKEDAPANYRRGVYLLLDTSGTYTEELTKAQQIINYLLASLESGDTFVVARIDSGSFSEKDIVAKIELDSRPSDTIGNSPGFVKKNKNNII